jgi:NAD-dependent deacetylase
MEYALDRVRAGDDDPACEVCGGILKSDVISFGQPLRESDLRRAEAGAMSADLLLAIGTSLTVYPIAAVPDLAQAAGARVVIVNAEPTPFDRRADAVLRGSIGEILPAIIAADRVDS